MTTDQTQTQTPATATDEKEATFGVSAKSPLAIYAPRVIETFFAADLNATIDSFGGLTPSLVDLTKRYNELSGNGVSVNIMRKWCKHLGFSIVVRPTISRVTPAPVPAPAAAGESFDKPVSGAAATNEVGASNPER